MHRRRTPAGRIFQICESDFRHHAVGWIASCPDVLICLQLEQERKVASKLPQHATCFPESPHHGGSYPQVSTCPATTSVEGTV